MLKKIKKKEVLASELEAAKELTHNLRDKIHAQKRFRDLFFSKLEQEEELLEMKRQIRDFEKEKKPIRIKWYGMNCPVSILKIKYYRAWQCTYFDLVREFKKAKKVLKKDYGMSDKDLSKIVEGKYDKDEKELDFNEKMIKESEGLSGQDYMG